MNVGSALKALKAEAMRLEEAGSRRLQRAKARFGATITISPAFEVALLDELRVKAAVLVLSGQRVYEIPESMHGLQRVGVTILVDPEQFQDFSDGTAVRQPADPTFGTFA